MTWRKCRCASAYRLNGKELREMPATNHDIERIEPVYETLPGWQQSTRGVSSYDELPSEARQYIEFLETRSEWRVGCVSTGSGAKRDDGPAGHTARIPARPVVEGFYALNILRFRTSVTPANPAQSRMMLPGSGTGLEVSFVVPAVTLSRIRPA